MDHLHHASLIDAVLGPRTREVLEAADFHCWNAAAHWPHSVSVRVASGVADDVASPCDDGGERIARVVMQTEVIAASLAVDPLLMMAHDENGKIGLGSVLVEPFDLRLLESTGGLRRDRRVHQRYAQPGHLDPEIIGVEGLTEVGVVISAHDVQLLAERSSIARFEGIEFLLRALRGQIALDENAQRVDVCDLTARCAVHDLRIRGFTGTGPLNRTLWIVVDLAALLLAEVHVVDA